MSSSKAALKAAKSALDANDYDQAIKEAQSVLSTDSQNYFARLFLGRAYEKKGQFDESAKEYHAAAKSKPDDAQAWIGLCGVYESQGSKHVDEYREAAVKLAEIQRDADDAYKCQTTINKFVDFAKKYGTKPQYKRAVRVLLPSSSIYDFLEGRIPHPAQTFTRLAEMTEEEESQKIKQEIAARRTRIGARIGQVTSDVKREIFASSDLESLYQEIINWTLDHEVRRYYEEKMLERAYDVLISLPAERKGEKLDQVLDLAEGMVTVEHSYQFAWDLVLETRDSDDLKELDVNYLRKYIANFPNSGHGRVLKGWLSSELSPFPVAPQKKDEEDEDTEKPVSPEDRLLLMTEGLTATESSPFAHRLVSDYYLHLEEHETAANTARTGLKALTVESPKLGMTLQNTKDALSSVLATALVHHQAPRNHAEARRLFEDILQRKPKWTSALIGLGLIFEKNEEYQNAIDFLSRALEQDRNNVQVGTELAWCRALSGDYAKAQEELEAYLAEMKASDPRARDLRAQVLHRIGICIWNLQPTKSARKDRNGAYSYFLAAIKTNVNFAPAYTYLGVYYKEYAKDKKRSRQCYQKAFELSPAETLAAEELARSFADQGDWDIVEVIAQRVIDTGRARPPPGSKRKGLSWPYSALGVVLMNKQDYSKAVTSFLSALRISPDDYQSYVGLGESYHNSGRYNSALRTFNHALDLSREKSGKEGAEHSKREEVWFARYMLANVHRELSEFDEAISGLQSVLEERPSEFGVLVSLQQTYVESAWRCVDTGLYGQAIEHTLKSISIAERIHTERPAAFNMWKGLGDACLLFSWVHSAVPDFPGKQVQTLLEANGDIATFEPVSDADQVSLEDVQASVDNDTVITTTAALLAAILSYKKAIESCSHDIHAQAVAWYNLGSAEHRAYICSPPKTGKKFLKAAVRCFKRAIELEAGNAEFWNALGVVTTTLNPKVAQHSFVRSLHLNELNAKVWTNLGVLYLLHNDFELAHQAFGRAQSTDPDYAHAWIGEGLVALMMGDEKEVVSHFTHAFEISDSASLISKRQYATSVFDHLLATPSASNDLTALIQPIFALEQLQRQTSSDLPYQHLAALFFERVGNHTVAISSLSSLCDVAEAEYEASESAAALSRFAHAKSDLARNQLAAKQFEAAVENAETALDLSSDEDSSDLDSAARTTLRLSSHLTAGLALYYLQRSSEAIGMFKSALQESGNDVEVVTSLVKVLWAHGGQDERIVAKEQLFESVEQHPEHVGSVTLLGAMAALEGDEDTAAAVRDDLVSLRTKDRLEVDEATQIESLLVALSALSPYGGVEESILAETQSSVMLNPSHSQSWAEISHVTGDTYSAQMALKTAQKYVPPIDLIDSSDLAKAFAGVGEVSSAQKALVLAPWEKAAWQAMEAAVDLGTV